MVVRESYYGNTISNKSDSGNSDLSNNEFDNIGKPWKNPGSSKTKSLSKTKNKYLKSKIDNNDLFESHAAPLTTKTLVPLIKII